MNASKYAVLYELMWAYVGRPYIWGGDDPIAGFDCSGLVLELLTSIGHWPEHQDATAQQIHDHFLPSSKPDVQEFGSLVFYGKDSSSITHISIIISPGFILEAGGGGSKTLTVEDAIKQNAFVRVRPFSHREHERVAVLLPNY